MGYGRVTVATMRIQIARLLMITLAMKIKIQSPEVVSVMVLKQQKLYLIDWSK